MFTNFLITFREGLEAALIIGIILAYLTKINRKEYFKHVFAGAGIGVLISGIGAYLFETLIGGFEGTAEQIFEGSVMLIAVIMLTFMLVWMNKQSKNLSGGLSEKINLAIGKNQIWALATLAFVSIIREGIEVVLFMGATMQNSPSHFAIIGAILGLTCAILLAWLILRSTVNINLGKFFKYSGLFIILIAAGMLSGAVHELEEAGVLPIIISHVWDITSFLNNESGIGVFLKAVFGYQPAPSLSEIASYVVYLSTSLFLYLKPSNRKM